MKLSALPTKGFIEGVSQMETVDTHAGEGSAAISPTFPRSQGSRGLFDLQRRNLQVTPSREPNRLPSEQTEKEVEYESRMIILQTVLIQSLSV